MQHYIEKQPLVKRIIRGKRFNHEDFDSCIEKNKYQIDFRAPLVDGYLEA